MTSSTRCEAAHEWSFPRCVELLPHADKWQRISTRTAPDASRHLNKYVKTNPSSLTAVAHRCSFNSSRPGALRHPSEWFQTLGGAYLSSPLGHESKHPNSGIGSRGRTEQAISGSASGRLTSRRDRRIALRHESRPAHSMRTVHADSPATHVRRHRARSPRVEISPRGHRTFDARVIITRASFVRSSSAPQCAATGPCPRSKHRD